MTTLKNLNNHRINPNFKWESIQDNQSYHFVCVPEQAVYLCMSFGLKGEFKHTSPVDLLGSPWGRTENYAEKFTK